MQLLQWALLLATLTGVNSESPASPNIQARTWGNSAHAKGAFSSSLASKRCYGATGKPWDKTGSPGWYIGNKPNCGSVPKWDDGDSRWCSHSQHAKDDFCKKGNAIAQPPPNKPECWGQKGSKGWPKPTKVNQSDGGEKKVKVGSHEHPKPLGSKQNNAINVGQGTSHGHPTPKNSGQTSGHSTSSAISSNHSSNNGGGATSNSLSTDTGVHTDAQKGATIVGVGGGGGYTASKTATSVIATATGHGGALASSSPCTCTGGTGGISISSGGNKTDTSNSGSVIGHTGNNTANHDGVTGDDIGKAGGNSNSTPSEVPYSTPEPTCHDQYQKVFDNLTTVADSGIYMGQVVGVAILGDQDYLTYGLADTPEQCLQACTDTAGCVFVNSYLDVEDDDTDDPRHSGKYTCALYKGCKGVEQARNFGGQNDPNLIRESNGYCRTSACASSS